MTTNKFISILDDIGNVIKKVFTNPTAEKIEAAGISLVGVAFPQFDSITNAVSSALMKAQTLAASANVTDDTTAMVAALALGDSQQVLAAGGITETAHQQAVVASIQQLLNLIPSPVVGATTTEPTPTPTPIPVSSGTAPSVQTQTQTGTLL